MLLFSFSSFSDRRSLKIENEKNNTKTLTYRTRVPIIQLINIEIYPGWLELPLTGTNFHGTKLVRAIEVLLYDLLLQSCSVTKNLFNFVSDQLLHAGVFSKGMQSPHDGGSSRVMACKFNL